MFILKSKKHIVNSLLDTDFYKFTMGQLVFHYHRNARVRYDLIVRTLNINLLDYFTVNELREEFEHVCSLRFSNSEIAYLRGIDEYGDRMFKEDYLKFLSELKLTMPEIRVRDGKLEVIVSGNWAETIYWETIVLCIVSELRSRHFIKDFTQFELDKLRATNLLNFHGKLDQYDHLWYDRGFRYGMSDFSTRRRGFHDWQDELVQIMAYRSPRDGDLIMYRGTSNVEMAYRYGQTPMGTIAHEAYQGYAGRYRKQGLIFSQKQLLADWETEYPGGGLTVALPDTFGSPFFLRKVFTPEQAERWKGLRQDSGDAKAIGQMYVNYYKSVEVDPMKKQVIFSDGLNPQIIKGLLETFYKKIGLIGFGPGSNHSNDFGFPSISFVMKLTEVDGEPVVKLSDNLAKGTGDEAEKQRIIIEAGYDTKFYETCTY